MKKENKLWRVFILREASSDFDIERKYINRNMKPIYRYGVSEKQVESRLRRSYGLKDHDENNGEVSVKYIFDITDAKPNGIITMTIWDEDPFDIDYAK